jgi:hypothetical protein
LDDTEISGPVLILNDTFGALSCALAEHTPFSIGDSYFSELATRECAITISRNPASSFSTAPRSIRRRRAWC